MRDWLKAAETLDKAADEMMIRGSCAKQYVNQDGQVCLEGAINVVLSGMASGLDYRSEVITYLQKQRSDARMAWFYANNVRESITDSLVDWNDEPGRTDEERVDSLRNAAKWARERAGDETS